MRPSVCCTVRKRFVTPKGQRRNLSALSLDARANIFHGFMKFSAQGMLLWTELNPMKKGWRTSLYGEERRRLANPL
jgi:hypothetical protein